MDLTYPPEVEAYRSEIRAFLHEALPDDWRGLGALPADERPSFLAKWRRTLVERRLIAPGWPTEYGGGGLGVLERSIVAEELIRAGVPHSPHPNDPYGFKLLGPTLLQWGTEAQKTKFLPPTVSGEIRWAQAYSEPDAGSDLFNLRTRAWLDGNEWVIDGQKIWQSSGLSANWLFALVRTDPEAVRSAGISFILIPIDQDGVDVRGIVNMAGETELTEVFFDGARADAANVIGGVNNGAKVALTLLGYERGTGGVADALAKQIELDRLIALANLTGRNQDPIVRQAIVRCRESVYALTCLGVRALSAGASGAAPGPESSILKLMSSEYQKTVTELAVSVLGMEQLTPAGAPAASTLGPQPLGLDPGSSSAWVSDFLHARPGTVYGGSSEIQRTTIGEQVLGLPREPRMSITAR